MQRRSNFVRLCYKNGPFVSSGQERHDELIETTEAEAVYAEEDRVRAGVIVTIGDDGDFRLYEGLVERAARPGYAGPGAAETAEDGDKAFVSDADRSPSPRPSTGEQQVRKECGFSQVLVDDLKAHRLQITKAHLADDFGVAFDLALYALCVDLRDRGSRARPLDLRAVETRPSSSLNDLAGTPADRVLEARENTLELDWLSLPPAEGFAALAALRSEAKQNLFAWCIAAVLNTQLAVEDRADPVIEAAGRRLAISFADYWRPTAANYWSRVKKAHGLAIGREILGDRWARDHAGDKKPELATALETAFDPVKSTASIGLDQAAREAATAWLPPGMAYAGAIESDSTDSDVDETAPLAGDPDDAKPSEIDLQAAELPAFLTEDEPRGVALNGAAAP